MANTKHVVTKLVAAGVMALAFATTSTANNLSQFTTVADTDFAMFGTGGMRNAPGNVNPSGTGHIVVSGLSGIVKVAFLYWQGPTRTGSPTANATVIFNGFSVTGTNIGFSADNCWNFANSQAYRADVTSFISGNGTYQLDNFVKGSTADINGVSLVVFYDDGNPANNRDFVIFDGNDSNKQNTSDADGWNATLPGIKYTSGTATMRLIIADGQVFPDNGLAITIDDGDTVTLVPSGNNWQGNSLPFSSGASVESMQGGLWDHSAYDITEFLSAGTHTVQLEDTGFSQDCLSMIAAIFDLPLGAAPKPGQLQIANSLTFPSQPIGVTSAAQTVTVTNIGDLPVTFTSVTISGPFVDAGSTCTSTTVLAPHATCFLSVAFLPTTLGPQTGAIVVSSSGVGSPQTINLFGSGQAGQLQLTSSYTFTTPQTVGIASNPASILVTNVGLAPVTITSVAFSGPFSSGPGTTCVAQLTVPASGTCTIAIVFLPTAVGTQNGNVVVTSTGQGSPQPVALSGTGIKHESELVP